MIKKKLFSLAVIVLCLSVAGGGTLAYFSDRTVAHNVITSGNIKIDLLETRADGSTFENVIGVMPGASVEKVVQVKNIGDNDAWIRVRVEKELTKANGQAGDADLLGINFDSRNWIARDGYYYYDKTLKSGDVTEPLFESVQFNASMGNDYQNSTAQVYVFAQATQTANNGETVLEANGWPED